jgi:hypothetical protein
LKASVAEGVSVRFVLSGMLTDTDISRNREDANLEWAVMATFGVAFQF